MSAVDYSLTLNGSAQQLSSVLAVSQRGGSQDEAFRQIILAADPANTAAVYIGTSSAVTSSVFGFALDPTQATARDRESIGPFEAGPVKLSDLWAIGTNNEKLHIFGIPY